VPDATDHHSSASIRRDRRRTLVLLFGLQTLVMATGWGWSIAQTKHQVPLSIGTALLVLLVTALCSGRLVKAHDRRLERANADLEDRVRDRVTKATSTRDALITGLARLADYRDSDTGAHLDRIAEYSAILAERLGATHPEINPDWIARLRVASSLHDIGKVGVPDAILLKPGPLDPAERREIQRHAVIGANTLMAVRETMGHDELVEMAMRVTLFHHERWDGGGYPTGLAGSDIPLEARIVAVADVYDALTSVRVYKPAMSHDEAVAVIHSAAGSHMDPEVVEAFRGVRHQFDDARRRLQSRDGTAPDVLTQWRGA